VGDLVQGALKLLFLVGEFKEGGGGGGGWVLGGGGISPSSESVWEGHRSGCKRAANYHRCLISPDLFDGIVRSRQEVHVSHRGERLMYSAAGKE